jgi:hypothetical protein
MSERENPPNGGGSKMWINLFTVALAIALGLGATAIIMQNDLSTQQASSKRRRRVSRVRG